ncbi:gamma-glutamyltranspeptidase [Schizophyllum fasciatum]
MSSTSPRPASRGAIASENRVASAIGAQILRDGGSAIDAAIATTLAVGTLCSDNSGIGGGGFALIRTPEGLHESLNFRPAAPAAVNSKMYSDKPGASAVGGLAVAVPGEIRGFEAMHRKYGRLPWSRLFEPSIKLAREGFPLTEDTARVVNVKTRAPNSIDPKSSWVYTHPTLSQWLTREGELLPIGTTLTRPEYAHTLEKIAEEGASAFYSGEIAQGIVNAVKTEGGVMTLEDLRGYEAREVEPLSVHYRGHKITSVGAPASGAVVLAALNILDNFEDIGGPHSVKDAHRMIESLKHAFAHRTLLGDPMFVPGLDAAQREFICPARGRLLRAKIDDSKVYAPSEYTAEGFRTVKTNCRIEIKMDHGTSHIVAADASGLVVSLTTTITLHWGSRIIVHSSGIVLNDSMEDFSVEGVSNFWGYLPTPANYIEGGKRPLSSTSPFIIEDARGRFRYAGGAAGGSRIVSCNVQQIRNVLDYDMDPAETLAHPRLHDQIAPQETHLEEGWKRETAADLQKLGHQVKWLPVAPTTACGVSYNPDTGEWKAAGEPRRIAAGGEVV